MQQQQQQQQQQDSSVPRRVRANLILYTFYMHFLATFGIAGEQSDRPYPTVTNPASLQGRALESDDGPAVMVRRGRGCRRSVHRPVDQF